MDLLSDNPKLGHITTFGGHPVIAAASLATLLEITETNLINDTLEKENLFSHLFRNFTLQTKKNKYIYSIKKK